MTNPSPIIGVADLHVIQRQLSAIMQRYYTQPAGAPILQYHSRTALHQEFHQATPPDAGLGRKR